jgi:antitoxin YefM
MRKTNLSEDIVPIGKFKTHASRILRHIHQTRRPLVITQNGKPSAVVLTPESFEDLAYREFVRLKVKAGIARSEKEGTYSTSEVRRRLAARVRSPRREG